MRLSATDLDSPGEADAFLDTLDRTPPDAITACRGWTSHEMIAHLASGADGFANHIEAHLEGRPIIRVTDVQGPSVRVGRSPITQSSPEGTEHLCWAKDCASCACATG
jgi:hypothetical protein